LWAGTILGACRLEAAGRRWRTWKIAQGLVQDHVYRMCDDGRMLWASCMNGGLVRYDPAAERFSAVARERGLGNTHIYAMAPAADGLWLGTAGGVNLRTAAGWDEAVCADGFTDYTVYAILPVERSVWFGTAYGLLRRDLDAGVTHRWTQANGLPHDEVTALLADADGVIAATKSGVVRIRAK
jgi:ligand-binding sensor domain-containing protein